ncbi:hypothetical protein RAA17_14465 [Komagataeibacter rhaeticus]|nr:hypothetical protein [Komagataeibacter rhaeticus]
MKAIYPVAGGDTLGITIGAGGGGGEGALPGNEGGTTVVSLNGTELFYIPGGGGSGKPTTANTAGGGGSMPVVVTPPQPPIIPAGTAGLTGRLAVGYLPVTVRLPFTAGRGVPATMAASLRPPRCRRGGAYDSGMTGSAHDGGAGGVACVTFRFIP